jgi:RimJ/RimL family protein N-acetyltransferase
LKVVETERLVLRRIRVKDAAFVRELVNEPAWIRYIGDKGAKTLRDAENYIRRGPIDMYRRLGFGLYRVETKESGEPVGICGLIKREALHDVDLGFAFLERHWGKGYALESATAMTAYARDVLRLPRIVAIASHDNRRSLRLLERIGFALERKVRLDVHGDELDLYAWPPRVPPAP